MAFSGNTYGSLSPRVGIIAVAKLLATAVPQLVLERFGMHEAVPKNKGLMIKFRRPIQFDPVTTELVEGVTPSPEIFAYEDVSVKLRQYGSWYGFTDVIVDTHEDNVVQDMAKAAGDQAAVSREALTWAVLTAGTSVVYSGAAVSRATVVAPITLNEINRAVRLLERNFAQKITEMVKPSVNIATQPVRPAYVLFGHTDLRQDFEAMTGFIPVENYSRNDNVLPYEIGSVRGVRVILTSHYNPLIDAGGSPAPGVLTGPLGRANVYQCVVVGKDAYGCVVLRGMDSAQFAIKKPKIGEEQSDPLGQRGFVAWKMWFACVRLNEAWMTRIECACSAL